MPVTPCPSRHVAPIPSRPLVPIAPPCPSCRALPVPSPRARCTSLPVTSRPARRVAARLPSPSPHARRASLPVASRSAFPVASRPARCASLSIVSRPARPVVSRPARPVMSRPAPTALPALMHSMHCSLPPPPLSMAITIYFIVTSLPDRLATFRDTTDLTIEVLESALKDVESNLRSVASAFGIVPPPLFHGCTVPQLPTFTASLTATTTDKTAAAVTTSARSRVRSGRRGGQGAASSGGGGGGVASGSGGSAGVGGAPRPTSSGSPAAAGGGDAWVRRAPAGLTATVQVPLRWTRHERDSFFLVVVDDYSRYTTIFPLAKKSDMISTLIQWLLATEGTRHRRVSCLHSDRGVEFCSGVLAGFCRERGILQSWTLPESPQQNGVAEHHIGLVMEIARTSMIHARAPHFLWPYAVRYAAHQLNLWPRISRPGVSPTSLWTGSPGVASRFHVSDSLAHVCNTSADKLSPCALPCIFLGFPEDSFDFTFYHPPFHRFLDSCDVRFDESAPYYTRYPCRGLPVPPPPLFLTSTPAPPEQPPPPPSVAPQVPSPSPQSSSQSPQQPSVLPPQAAADPEGVGFRSADPGGAASVGVGVGAESVPARVPGTGGAGVGAVPIFVGGSSLLRAGVCRAVTGGATTGGAGAPSAGPGEPGTGRVAAGSSGSGGGATGALESGPGATTAPNSSWRSGSSSSSTSSSYRSRSSSSSRRRHSNSSSNSNGHLHLLSLAFGPLVSPPLLLSPPPPLLSTVPRFLLLTPPGLSPPSPSPSMLPSPPDSALTASLSTSVNDYYRTYRPVLSRVLASLVTDPRASLSSVSALTATVTEFAATRRLDYATRVMAAPPTSPLAVEGESALGCDALEDRKLTGPFPNEPFEPCGPYPELVGCLMYLMTCTRPDLAFPRSILAHFVAPRRHRLVHRTAVVRVAKYLATTSGVGLVLGRRQPVMLTGHCETSYADDVETHRSTQGYSFSLGSGAVSWRSNRSSSVSTSTAEAEIYAGVVAA
ncbi:unnamed protein product [Closterium sp. NIES-54]